MDENLMLLKFEYNKELDSYSLQLNWFWLDVTVNERGYHVGTFDGDYTALGVFTITQLRKFINILKKTTKQ